MKKYEFTGKTMQYDGCTLHQIRALRDLYINRNPNHPNPKPDVTTAICVHAGNIGGWIQSEDNLSYEGNCWVDHNAKVYGHASVKDNAYVGGEAIVCCSTIAENARVLDNADVNEDSVVFGNAIICDKMVLMIAEDDLPKISEKTISNLQLPTVSELVNLFFSEVRILVSL